MVLSPRQSRVVLLPGDGVGPEVIAEARRVLELVAKVRAHKVCLTFTEELIGGASIDAAGALLTEDALTSCKAADAILLGAVGGPKWSTTNPQTPEQGLLTIRKILDLYANVHPSMPAPDAAQITISPLKESIVLGVNFMMNQQSMRDTDFGKVQKETTTTTDTETTKDDDEDDENDVGIAKGTFLYSKPEIERVTRLAATLALQHEPVWPIHSVIRINNNNNNNNNSVLASPDLWHKTVTDVIKNEYPQLKLHHHDQRHHHLAIDSATTLPCDLNGIVLIEDLFGEIILSPEVNSFTPSSAHTMESVDFFRPSASLSGLQRHDKTWFGLYGPIHGPAPDIAGRGIVNPVGAVLSAAMLLRYSLGMEAEAVAVEDAVHKVLDDPEHGGFGFCTSEQMDNGKRTTREIGNKILEVLERELFGLNAAERTMPQLPSTRALLGTSTTRAFGRRGMTITEKILLHHAIGLSSSSSFPSSSFMGNIRPGDMICVSVDWTLASEITWKGMEKTYDQMERPEIYRNDRFWLAIDHVVDPRINHLPKPKELIKSSTDFAKEAKLVDFLKPNYSILHTEFYRERAQPGQLIIGADSHTCSAGAVGAFAVGLGAADVVLPLVTGETWFKVPETVQIRFINRPRFGIHGKDIILFVLQQLKRNTVAFERSVEYTGPGMKYLSCDARFALSNMATEFGGIAGVCEADEITAKYIAKRKNRKHKNSTLFFKADEDAVYAETHVIDLSRIDSLVALYPEPDNCVSVEVCAGIKLDGCFIGACTTTEEDLILAALVLEVGLNHFCFVPVLGGQKRKVTPGSLPIIAKLRRLGLLKIYEQAGFEIGVPGCSYCVGIAADQAGEGEVWLTSQNRNFRNRMGKGAIGHLASAATVAASSFEMKIRNPRDLLDRIDYARFEEMLGLWNKKDDGDKPMIDVVYSEPMPVYSNDEMRNSGNADSNTPFSTFPPTPPSPSPPSFLLSMMKGRVQRFGDNVDTDAIIPAQFMPGQSDQDLGTHAFQFFKPEFCDLVQKGFDIIVGGHGFGSGSSREEAPRALRGAGVKAVIAKSFAFIYSRNQPNMSLLGILIEDESFYEHAQEGIEITIDVKSRKVYCHGLAYPFGLSLMEERLLAGGGVTEMYRRYGKQLFRVAMADEQTTGSSCGAELENAATKQSTCDGDLSW